jgi:hypothetical protein
MVGSRRKMSAVSMTEAFFTLLRLDVQRNSLRVPEMSSIGTNGSTRSGTIHEPIIGFCEPVTPWCATYASEDGGINVVRYPWSDDGGDSVGIDEGSQGKAGAHHLSTMSSMPIWCRLNEPAAASSIQGKDGLLGAMRCTVRSCRANRNTIKYLHTFSEHPQADCQHSTRDSVEVLRSSRWWRCYIVSYYYYLPG